MLLSSFYHIFGLTSIERRRLLLRFDIFGISSGLLSIYLMGIYTAFLCHEVPSILISPDHSKNIAFFVYQPK